MRHLSLREPERKGYDRLLRQKQRYYLYKNKNEVRKFLEQNILIEVYEVDMDTSVKLLVTKDHIKKKMRQEDYKVLDVTRDYVKISWLNGCVWKLKLDEYAKIGKIGRIVVDLGVSASLQGAEIAEHCKKNFGDRDLIIDDSLFHFVTQPSPDKLKYAFNLLRESSLYRVVLIAFSDDACIAYNDNGKWRSFNLDFSSCDSSHTTPIFEEMFNTFRVPKEYKKALLGQIRSPIRIDSPHKEMKEPPIIIHPTELYLQSGITITTLMNTFAWMACFLNIRKILHITIDSIQKSCEELGYITTIEENLIPEDITFLKANPVLCTCHNEYQPVMNLGVIYRASGVCRRDLPGRRKTPIHERATTFQSQLMNGLTCTIDNTIISTLNPGKSSVVTIVSNAQRNNLHTGKVHSYSNDNLFRRYRATPEEIDTLTIHSHIQGFGTTTYDPLVSKILTKDYGLRTPILD